MRNIITIFALITGLAAAQTPAATNAKVAPPPPGPARPFVFPAHQTVKLPNGLTIFIVEDHREPLVAYRLVVNAGSSTDDPKKAGLASLTASLLREGGTRTHTSQQIAKLVDDVGGSLQAGAGLDTASVFATFVKSSGDRGLDLLADIILNPVFDAKELDRYRQRELSGLQVQYNNATFLVGRLGPRLVYGSHPYGYPTEGTPDTLRAITRDDIVKFHHDHYVPAGAYLAIAGDVNAKEITAKVEKYLGEWKGSAPPAHAMPRPPAPQRKVVLIDKPDAAQTEIFVAEPGVARNNPDYIALELANQIYGGGYTSRLNAKLRASEGLTYGARSTVDSRLDAGAFITTTSTRSEKTAEALKMIVDLQKEYAANPVTEPELEDAKAYVIGTFELGLETADAVANEVVTAALNHLPDNYWETYVSNVRSTTADQVAAAAKKYFHPDTTEIAIVGNAAKFSKDLTAIGPVKTIKLAEFDELAPDLMRTKAPEATAETRAKGKALIDAAVTAVGGADALKSAKDLTSKGTLAMKGPQGEMKIETVEEIAYPDKYKSTMTLPFGQIVQTFDGKMFWMKQGQQSRDLPQGIPEAQRLIAVAGGIGLLRDAEEGRAQVYSLDDKTVLWKEGESEVKIGFDPETHRIATLSYTSVGPTGRASIDEALADYRDVAGIQLPFKETLSQAGQPAGERTFSERKLNGGIPPDTFVKK